MRLIVPLFNQRDSSWQGHTLGTGSTTIGGYGCLLSCIAMIAKYYGKDTDPDRLNNSLKAVNGYLNGNLYKWYEGVTKVYSDIVCTKLQSTPAALTPAQFAEMRAELDAGRPVVLFVDFKPETAAVDMHFVLLIGYELINGVYIYYVNDPWFGDTTNLTRYGDPAKTIQQYAFHTGPIQATDTIPVKKADFENLVTKATKLDNQNPPYETIIQTNQDIKNENNGLKTENGSYKDFIVAVANKLQVPATTSGILGAVDSIVGVEDQLRKERENSKQLSTQLGEAQGTIQTKIEEAKVSADTITQLTIDKKTLSDANEKLTIINTDLQTKLDQITAAVGTPGQFTRSAVINYLLNNLFNKSAWAKE